MLTAKPARCRGSPTCDVAEPSQLWPAKISNQPPAGPPATIQTGVPVY